MSVEENLKLKHSYSNIIKCSHRYWNHLNLYWSSLTLSHMTWRKPEKLRMRLVWLSPLFQLVMSYHFSVHHKWKPSNIYTKSSKCLHESKYFLLDKSTCVSVIIETVLDVPHPAFISFKLRKETLEQDVKYVQN